jgi:hypothetical protein
VGEGCGQVGLTKGGSERETQRGHGLGIARRLVKADDEYPADVIVLLGDEGQLQTAAGRRNLGNQVRVATRAVKLAEGLALSIDAEWLAWLQRQSGWVLFQHGARFTDNANGGDGLPFELG